MKMYFWSALAAIATVTAAAQPASAGSVYAEGNGVRADGHWGGELGLGYGIGMAGFNLSAGGGAFIYKNDGDTTAKAYGRIEATYHIPLFATLGAGARIGDKVRPYATIALPVGPILSLKANGGPHYAALGLRAGF
jgi:hypothetical protein